MEIKFTNVLLSKGNVILNFIMRTFLFLFCATVLGFTPKDAFSQNVKVVIDKNKTVTVDEVFNLIKKQTDYTFIYRSDLFENHPKVKLTKGVIAANELLQKSINIKDFNFNVDGKNTISISKTTSDQPKQETFTITGTVKDVTGQPLVGASVVIDSDKPGSNSLADGNFIIRGTATDFDGKFTIEATLNHYLYVGFIGFDHFSQEITSRTQTTFDIILNESENKLDEVVVTGYTQTQKRTSTVASSKINKESIDRQVTTNLDDKLEGLAPGLTLNSVTPDGGQSRLEIILRGISTFDEGGGPGDPVIAARNALNRQPLIVVDGFPYEGPFNDIDAKTIETIDVLRDAAATTLWGARASNGVIVITTKRGTLGMPQISISSAVTMGTKQDVHKFGLASSADAIKIFSQYNEIEPSGFENIANQVINQAFFGPGYKYAARLDPFDQIWASFYNGDITESERNTQLNALGQVDNLNDFEKYLLRGGITRQNSLSIRGGSQMMNYSFTATHTDEQRPNVGDDFERLNLALTTDLKFNRRFSLVADIAIASSKRRDNGIGVQALYTGQEIPRYAQLVDGSGNPLPVNNVFNGYYDEFMSLGFDEPSYSPILNQRALDNETTGFNIRLATGINYKITDDLTADVKYQYNRVTGEVNNHKSKDLHEVRRFNNGGIVNPDMGVGFVTRATPYGGQLERQTDISTNSVFRGSLNFDKKLGGVHQIGALAGIEFSESEYSINKQKFYGYNDTTGLYDRLFNPAQFGQFGSVPSYLGGFVVNYNDYTPVVLSRHISTFANANYSYKGRYNINASGKIDQATAFGLNKRLSKPLFWAVGASWNIDREDFFKSSWVDQLKLRASYGKNGNLRRGLTTVSTIRFGSNDWINGENDASIDTAGNPNLNFETTTTTNFGLDFGLFNRVRGTFDVYSKQSTDLLTVTDLNPSFGQGAAFNGIYTNNGEISNKGFEVSFNADVLKSDNFRWNTNINFSHNKNKVLAYGDISEDDAQGFYFDVSASRKEIVGHDVSSEVRYKWGGLDSNGDPQVFNDSGDLVTWNTDKSLWPTMNGMAVTKPFISPTFGGITNTFEYKNFTLSFLATFKFGHVFQETLRNKYPYRGGNFSGQFHEDVADAWENPGDEAFTDIPAIPRYAANWWEPPGENSYDRRAIFEFSDAFMHDASHVRLRDITLAYNFGEEVLEKIGFDAATLTFQARNLGLIWAANDRDIDPESVPFSGRQISFNDNFPLAYRPGIRVPATFVVGAKLNF